MILRLAFLKQAAEIELLRALKTRKLLILRNSKRETKYPIRNRFSAFQHVPPVSLRPVSRPGVAAGAALFRLVKCRATAYFREDFRNVRSIYRD
jgi:hypothetical protein